MRLGLVLLITGYSVFVDAETAWPIDYDDYSEDPTTARITTAPISNKPARKPSKKDKDAVVYSIEQFLDTTEEIWVYNSTEETNVTCRVDVIEGVDTLYAIVKRYSLSNGTISTIDGDAVLSSHPNLATVQDPPNEMKIESQSNSNPYETLIYMNENHDCGVFYVNYHSETHLLLGTWFELRIRNSSLAQGPDPVCSYYFEQYSSKQSVTYSYTPPCLCMLQYMP
uniref:p27 protein n=1 Tax=Hyalomma asiaticum TaxID=266040 RepID=A8VM53_HYAAI|nr:P27 protein [Hyalomma asiaticum]